jgi:D-alanyl-D-alanine carboxypeptidase
MKSAFFGTSLLAVFFICSLFFFSCARSGSSAERDAPAGEPAPPEAADPLGQYLNERDPERILDEFLSRVLTNAGIPPGTARQVMDAAAEGPAFILDLLTCLNEDRGLRMLVDKDHALPAGFEPEDLVELREASYRVGRQGLRLRRIAEESLEEMAAAARADGITLLASSAYRSYAYQEELYARNVRELGQAAADRESARPGRSQHQTGLVVDFGSIDDSFAGTPAGRWMAANAGRFGWSLSFPDGYEEVTGYRWESWHYRYVGRDLASFIDTYFGGIQQYALRFIHEWEAEEGAYAQAASPFWGRLLRGSGAFA